MLRTWETWDAVLRSLGRVVCWPPSLDKPHAISTKSGAFRGEPQPFFSGLARLSFFPRCSHPSVSSSFGHAAAGWVSAQRKQWEGHYVRTRNRDGKATVLG